MNRFFYIFFIVFNIVSFDVIGQELARKKVSAAEFQSYDINGKSLALSNLLANKPVVLYFWATWCPYCKKVTPKLVDFHNKYADKITVIGVNVGVDDSLAEIKSYVEAFKINFPVIFDDKNVVTPSYDVHGTPVFVVVSQTQEIVYRGHRFPVSLEKLLEDQSD